MSAKETRRIRIRNGPAYSVLAVALACAAAAGCELGPQTVPAVDGAFLGDPWDQYSPAVPIDRGPPYRMPDTAANPCVSPAIDPLAPLPEANFGGGGSPVALGEPEPKEGFLQEVAIASSWLPRNGRNGMGTADLQLDVTVAVPAPSRETPLVLTPSFASHSLDGPSKRDMPPQVYDAFVEIHWMGYVAPEFGLDVSVTPGLFSDFEQSDRSALRVAAGALAEYVWSPTTKLTFGLLYLGRDDVKLLPAGGVAWLLDPDTRLDLVFPNPKFTCRYFVDDFVELSWHIAGEFGGGAWAFSHADGVPPFLA